MDYGNCTTSRVEKHAVPVVVGMPALEILRLQRRFFLVGPFISAKVDDESVPVVALPNGVNSVLPATDFDGFIPGLGGEFFRGDLAMAWEVMVLSIPGGLVIGIVIDSRPEVLHPFVDVLRLDGLGDSEPSFGQKVIDVFGSEIFVVLVKLMAV